MKYLPSMITRAALALFVGGVTVTTLHAQETCITTTYTKTTIYYYSDGTIVTVSWSQTFRSCMPSEM